MHPAWSVILFTTLAGAGQGLFLALVVADFVGAAPQRLSVVGAALALALCAAGLVASTFHLGRPARGWRAASRWRTSWLSREIIVLPLFLASIAAWGAAHALALPAHALGAAGALLAVTLPNPLTRNPAKPGPGLRRLAGVIERRAARSGGYVGCLQ